MNHLPFHFSHLSKMENKQDQCWLLTFCLTYSFVLSDWFIFFSPYRDVPPKIHFKIFSLSNTWDWEQNLPKLSSAEEVCSVSKLSSRSWKIKLVNQKLAVRITPAILQTSEKTPRDHPKDLLNCERILFNKY